MFPISAVSSKGLRTVVLLSEPTRPVQQKEPVVYEPEFDPALRFFKEEPYVTITVADDVYSLWKDRRSRKMLGHTNMDSEGIPFLPEVL